METTEEKAKAYDEALEKAKELYNRGYTSITGEIFPELAESNDEKVRKALIDFFGKGAKYGGQTNGVYDKDILAWLEKQGETSPVLSNFSNIGKDEQKPLGYVHHIDEDGYYTKEAILEPNPYTGTGFDYNGHHWGMCARDGGVEILMDGNITSRVFPDKNNIIEQKPTDSYCQENCKGFQETGKCFADGECKAKKEAEQKPVIKFKTAEESLGISSDEYNKIVDECLFGEQKLTEFERGLFDMLTDISKPRTADCVKSHSEKLLSIARKMIALEQKPEENKGNIGGISANSEWNEEDEQHVNSLLKRLEGMCKKGATYTATRFPVNQDINWLKSIKDRVQPQNRWNPSELQLGCLSDAIEHYNSLGYPAPKLKELLDDLKELKGEV